MSVLHTHRNVWILIKFCTTKLSVIIWTARPHHRCDDPPPAVTVRYHTPNRRLEIVPGFSSEYHTYHIGQ